MNNVFLLVVCQVAAVVTAASVKPVIKHSGLKRQYSVEKLAEAGFLSLESHRAASEASTFNCAGVRHGEKDYL